MTDKVENNDKKQSTMVGKTSNKKMKDEATKLITPNDITEVNQQESQTEKDIREIARNNEGGQ